MATAAMNGRLAGVLKSPTCRRDMGTAPERLRCIQIARLASLLKRSEGPKETALLQGGLRSERK